MTMQDCVGVLRRALADLIVACGKVECDSPEALAMGQAALDAKRAMEQSETRLVGGLAASDVPEWIVRRSKTRGHEDELTLAVYTAAGETVCRVMPNGDRERAERDVMLLAGAPAMLNALRDACKFLRGSGMCIHPDCARCKIGICISDFGKTEAER